MNAPGVAWVTKSLYNQRLNAFGGPHNDLIKLIYIVCEGALHKGFSTATIAIVRAIVSRCGQTVRKHRGMMGSLEPLTQGAL